MRWASNSSTYIPPLALPHSPSSPQRRPALDPSLAPRSPPPFPHPVVTTRLRLPGQVTPRLLHARAPRAPGAPCPVRAGAPAPRLPPARARRAGFNARRGLFGCAALCKNAHCLNLECSAASLPVVQHVPLQLPAAPPLPGPPQVVPVGPPAPWKCCPESPPRVKHPAFSGYSIQWPTQAARGVRGVRCKAQSSRQHPNRRTATWSERAPQTQVQTQPARSILQPKLFLKKPRRRRREARVHHDPSKHRC